MQCVAKRVDIGIWNRGGNKEDCDAVRGISPALTCRIIIEREKKRREQRG
jgi:hypothetical protein